jgi:hypothetical protein
MFGVFVVTVSIRGERSFDKLRKTVLVGHLPPTVIPSGAEESLSDLSYVRHNEAPC